jgi:hypothetical protein
LNQADLDSESRAESLLGVAVVLRPGYTKRTACFLVRSHLPLSPPGNAEAKSNTPRIAKDLAP